MNSNDKKSKDNIIKRIKKCLAIAGDSAATSNEAATALRQAQALMREYDLSMIDVENADFKITQEFMKMARQQLNGKDICFPLLQKHLVFMSCEHVNLIKQLNAMKMDIRFMVLMNVLNWHNMRLMLLCVS